LTEFLTRNGFMWPASDGECHQAVFGSLSDLDHAYARCSNFRVVVQAGGNCGVWPKELSHKFETVYTFEPDPVNFRCLAANVPEHNVFKFNGALGAERRLVELEREPRNIGAHQVAEKAGSIPTLLIDDLGLEACDLIYLDIEGYELNALLGARRTIEACRPVVAVEDKGLSERYGVPQGAVERWLEDNLGYRVVDRVGRDVILIPS